MTTTYATKSQILDYVTKGEFKEFKDEMYEFRTEMYEFRAETHERFNLIDKKFVAIDKKFVIIEKKIDDLKDEVRRSMGVMYDQFRSDLRAGMEYFGNVDKKKVDQKEFDALRLKINQRFFEGREVV